MKKVILYLCDPDKNTECSKTHCKYKNSKGAECGNTSKREYAALNENGEPIVVYDSENPPPLERRRKSTKN